MNREQQRTIAYHVEDLGLLPVHQAGERCDEDLQWEDLGCGAYSRGCAKSVFATGCSSAEFPHPTGELEVHLHGLVGLDSTPSDWIILVGQSAEGGRKPSRPAEDGGGPSLTVALVVPR